MIAVSISEADKYLSAKLIKPLMYSCAVLFEQL